MQRIEYVYIHNPSHRLIRKFKQYLKQNKDKRTARDYYYQKCFFQKYWTRKFLKTKTTGLFSVEHTLVKGGIRNRLSIGYKGRIVPMYYMSTINTDSVIDGRKLNIIDLYFKNKDE